MKNKLEILLLFAPSLQLSCSPASEEESNGGAAGDLPCAAAPVAVPLLHSFACESYKSLELIWAMIQYITLVVT